MRCDALAHVVTTDGKRLALHRYHARGSVERRHAVVCCHGLGSNHYVFDADRDVSLARHLSERGFERRRQHRPRTARAGRAPRVIA